MENLLEGYRSEADVARELGVHIRTLQHWRYVGKGPRYIRKGRDVLYVDDDVRVWLAAGGTNALAARKRSAPVKRTAKR